MGPNGVGKTTCLKVLLGELEPDAGTVTLGKRTRVAYYDQARASLDGEQTVYQAAGGGSPGWHGEDFIDVGGRKVALRDYLDDLLFPPQMQQLKVKALSGGERNRLLLARLFLEGANVLVLDEPTNDLDLVTLNVLERLLLDLRRDGAAGHPRPVLPRQGGHRHPGLRRRREGDAVGGELRHLPAAQGPGRGGGRGGGGRGGRGGAGRGSGRGRKPAPAARSARPRPGKPGKLSFKDQREYEGIEAAIQAAEARKAALEASMADPATYQRGGADWSTLRRDFDAASAEVERLYARWEALEALKAGG